MTDQPEQGDAAVEAGIEALRQGRMVIVVDAEERENEGDFVCGAETMTPEMVDFMLKIGRGTMCTPITQELASKLRLSAAVDDTANNSPNQTQFLTAIDHIHAGTGVSPANRATTINALGNPTCTADEFVRPGHIFPLLAKEGGVLRRAGHTEATLDLLRLAGQEPVGVLIEICSNDGHGMATYEELKEIAEEHDIPIVSIEDLIRYRRIREQLVKREVEVDIPTGRFGSPKVVGYSVAHEKQEPLAIVWGDLSSASQPPLVRMHSSCFTGDVLDSLRCDCGDQLSIAMQMINAEGAGVVVYLPQEGRGIGLMAKLQAYKLQDQGCDTVEANHKLGFKADMRDYMVGLQILKDLGLSEIRLLTNNPKKTNAFVYAGVNLQVVEQVPIIAPPHAERENYMATKRDKMGHMLPGDE
jgi:3,4-dihydroxy 2-butanone 4-phosphate synthase/GTP cyclohydrolase II